MPLRKPKKKQEKKQEEIGHDEKRHSGLVLVKDGVQREVSFEELALSNTLTLEALVRVLSRNGNIDPNELLAEMEKVKAERFREGSPNSGDDVAH